MKGKWDTIRDFLKEMGWATPENICYRIYGESNAQLINDVEWILTRMKNAKHPEKRVKELKNSLRRIYAPYDCPKHDKGNFSLIHDEGLRNVLAVMKRFYPKADIRPTYPQDAKMQLDGNIFYIEYDTGHEYDNQLTEKLTKNYLADGSYRVIFIMADRYRNPDNEPGRLEKLFKISGEVLKKKKGRILGACYGMFLETGEIVNHKGEKAL